MSIRTPADLGTALRNARTKQGRTQAAVSADAGISRDSYIRIEQGHPRVELANVLSVIEALGLHVELADDARGVGADDRASDSSDVLDSVFRALQRGD